MSKKSKIDECLTNYGLTLILPKNKKDFQKLLNARSNTELIKMIKKYSNVKSSKLYVFSAFIWKHYFTRTKKLNCFDPKTIFVLDSIAKHDGALIINDFYLESAKAKQYSKFQISKAIEILNEMKIVDIIPGYRNSRILTVNSKIQAKMEESQDE